MPRAATRAVLAVAGVAVTGLAIVAPAQADPLWPGGPDVPGVPALIPPGWTPPQLPGTPPPPKQLAPQEQPAVFPANGEVVGAKRAVDVFFRAPIVDRPAAESTIVVTPSTPVAGHFNWVDDSHLQWVPDDYWPRNTGVTVAATGAQTAFQISDAFEAVGDADGHTFSVKIGGDVVRTFPAALGKPGHETPNGTFHVLAKEADVVMDSSTYGVPIDAPEGYRVDVKWATRLTWDGIYVHAAPWSVDQQGNSNVSHGCINLSTTNAKWYYDNVRNGDAVTIVNA
jgi:lipoprotein-anchoring transpeptidase ErfK/SrfK